MSMLRMTISTCLSEPIVSERVSEVYPVQSTDEGWSRGVPVSQGAEKLPEKDGVGDCEVEWCGISSSADSSVRCDEQQNS